MKSRANSDTRPLRLRRFCHFAEHHQLLRRAPRRLQEAQDGRLRGRAAEKLLRQGPEESCVPSISEERNKGSDSIRLAR